MHGSLETTLTLLSFAVADRYVSLIILATSSAESSVAGKLAFWHKSRIFKNYTMKHSSQYAQYNSLFYLESKLMLSTQTILPSFLTMVGEILKENQKFSYNFIFMLQLNL